MRFFEKLFGSSSNSDKNNDYAKATLEFATSPDIDTSNAIVYTKRELDFKTKGESQITPRRLR
jgi:hypothetical protein